MQTNQAVQKVCCSAAIALHTGSLSHIGVTFQISAYASVVLPVCCSLAGGMARLSLIVGVLSLPQLQQEVPEILVVLKGMRSLRIPLLSTAGSPVSSLSLA